MSQRNKLCHKPFFIEDFDAIKEIKKSNKSLSRLKNKVQNEIFMDQYFKQMPQKFSYLNKKLSL